MFKKERRKWDFLAKSWAAKCMNHVKQSRPCAKRSGSCSGISMSAEGVERFGKIVDSKIIFWGL
jgi:hypothetical protein